MTRRTRAALVVAILGALCMLLVPAARSAAGSTPTLESYQATGVASGVRFSFTFTNSIFERLVDLVLPFATSDLRSEGGGQERSEAAVLYPGDLVGGSVGEALPGYTIAYAPQPNGKNDETEEEETAGLPFPPSVPLGVGVGRNKVVATPNESSSETTAARIVIGTESGPHLEIGAIHSAARGLLSGSKATQLTRTEVTNLALVVNKDVTIRIRKLVSEVQASSDGTTGSVDSSSFTVSGVEVTMAGQTFAATLDNSGIHLAGLPSDQIPEFTPVSLDPKLQSTLYDQGIRVFLGTSIPIIDGALADGSIGGLLIQFTGTIPVVPIPPIVAELQKTLEDAILPALPPQVRELYQRPTCLGEDVVPKIPKPIFDSLPEELINGIGPLFALCLGREALPGPGTGSVTTLTIGSVQSLAVAGVSLPASSEDGSTDGGIVDGFTDGGFTGGFTGGGFTNGGGTGTGTTPPATPRQLFGLVARMPSGALIGTGAGFLVLAVVLAFGPSLGPWRRTT